MCPERPGDLNQSLMELGATVCTPQKPKCHECPVQQLCCAYQEQKKTTVLDIEQCASDCSFCLKSNEIDTSHSLVENYPRKKLKTKQRQETVFILILYRLKSKLEFLMIKQKQAGLLSGLWSFLEINPSSDIEQMNERKRKCFIIDELHQMKDVLSSTHFQNIKLAGQVCRCFQIE